MFIIYDKNKKRRLLPNDVRPLDIFISSIDKDIQTSSIEGRDGVITVGETNRTRKISIELGVFAKDTQDYRLLRSELYALFNGEFYVAESYQRGKLYKVTVDQSYIPERLNSRVSRASLELITVRLPYAESIGTTQDIQRDGISSESPLWGFGMGLQADDDTLKYTFEGTNFQVYNAGNVGIHPFMQELKITINDVVGSTSYLELTNTTNGTSFRINEGVSGNQEIVLDGPNVTSNSLVIDPRTTNRGLIQLSPGWNNFEIKGATDAVTAFDFRFYYM